MNCANDRDLTMKSSVSEVMNRESSINSISVTLIHQEVTRQTSRFEIDGCSLEIVRIIGKVANVPTVQANCTSFYLSDLTKSTQSVNPVLCTMWQVNVDNYSKSIQSLKKQRVKLIGSLDFDGAQIVLNILSVQPITSDLDVKYYQLEVQLQSMQRKLMLRQLVQKASSISKTFNHPSEYERTAKKPRIEGTVTPPMKQLSPLSVLETRKKNEMGGFMRASAMDGSNLNLFSPSIKTVTSPSVVVKQEDDDTAIFYLGKIKDILMEHGSSPKCIGLSVTEIMFFLDKQRVQVPDLEYMNGIVQKLLYKEQIFENISEHFKISVKQ